VVGLRGLHRSAPEARDGVALHCTRDSRRRERRDHRGQAERRLTGARKCYDKSMLTVRARVKNGRLVVDEPTDLPEGSEVELAAVEDDLDDDDRARLHAALDAADGELRAGKGIPGEQVIAALRRNAL
jgi:hypothetical protein